MNPIGEILGLGGKILDKIFPDKAQADAAKIKLLELQQQGEFKSEELRYSSINKEAESNDPWTSRARPSFLYVMYIMILMSIPFSILFAFKPDVASAVTTGMNKWLTALPEEMWWLFGSGYLGYSVSRSYDKGVDKKYKK